MATSDRDYEQLVLGPAFAALRPFNADVCRKIIYFLVFRPKCIDLRGARRLFDQASATFHDLGRNTETADVATLLRLPALVPALWLGPLFFRAASASGWRELWSRCRKSGLLQNPYLRMQLAMVGSYTGQCAAQLEWLMCETSRPVEFAEALCFVRRVGSPDLSRCVAEIVRGRPPPPGRAFYEAPPLSSVRRLLEYVRTCIRDQRQFCNAGMALRLLTWVDEAGRLAEAARDHRTEGLDPRTMSAAFRRLQHVQQMEKGRFWTICEGVRRQSIRARLESLWTKTYFHDAA